MFDLPQKGLWIFQEGLTLGIGGAHPAHFPQELHVAGAMIIRAGGPRLIPSRGGRFGWAG